MKLEKLKLNTTNKKLPSYKLLWNNVPLISDSLQNLNASTFIAESLDVFKFNLLYAQPRLYKSSELLETNPFFFFFNSTELSFYKYKIFRKSSFINFFENHNVDVPKYFKKVNSLRRLNFEQPLLKFTNYLMKHGNKEKILSLLALNFHRLFRIHKKGNIYLQHTNFIKWSKLYYFYNNIFNSLNNWHPFVFNLYLSNVNNNFSKLRQIYHLSQNTIKPFLLKTLIAAKPLFKFSIYSIDKRIKKFTRKKGLKYVFIWKYVPVYKRKLQFLRLITNTIKFNSGKTLNERTFDTFLTLWAQPHKTQAYQILKFTHNYVFKNFKRSLLKQFTTVS